MRNNNLNLLHARHYHGDNHPRHRNYPALPYARPRPTAQQAIHTAAGLDQRFRSNCLRLRHRRSRRMRSDAEN